MWSRISHALKVRTDLDPPPASPTIPSSSHSISEAQADVMSRVYEQHPNLSVFHPETPTVPDVPFPTPSPPGSPSKHGRRGMFKRISRAPDSDGSGSLRLLPKKVKSSLNLTINTSQTSLARASTDTARDPRPSIESTAPSSARQPNTSLDAKGSVRSILRDPKTPGTGQNVRFFSRDAYKVISPDASLVSSDAEPTPALSFLDKLNAAAPRTRPSAAQIFAEVTEEKDLAPAPASEDSLMLQVPPPDFTNLFDMSQEHELPPIPKEGAVSMLDGAVEVTASETRTFTSTPMKPAKEIDEEEDHPAPPPGLEQSPVLQHDRSQSFSFGQTVFHSLARSSSPSVDTSVSSSGGTGTKSRSRALSDSMFQALIRASSASGSSSGSSSVPEADINDDSSRELAVFATPEPDPFRVNATTYYTPQTLIPPTPPQATHVRTASKEEDALWSLRTQLAVQQELCAQYEVDLGARDALVAALKERAEGDARERRGAVRSWRKKVAELERACRALEEEVDASRAESVERSVMDEASGEALRQLHRQIAGLERERGEVEEARKLLETRLLEKEASEQALREGIKQAKEEMEALGNVSINFGGGEGEEELRRAVREAEGERERYQMREAEWEKERAALVADVESGRAELARRTEEQAVLKAELEAQWKHTEAASERIQGLERSRDTLSGEVDTLKGEVEALKGDVEAGETRVHEMEAEWTEGENKRGELERELEEVWAAKEGVEREREELEEQLVVEREHTEDLTQALQEREDRVSELDREQQFALERVAQLEANIRKLNGELSASSAHVNELESAAEALREEISTLRRADEHAANEQARAVADAVARETDARAQMEAAVREKAEADVMLAALRERAGEADRLRRVVHELQQESADKEVKIVQLTKGRAQDKEDVHGLNIALDSKQQELELLKRRLGVKGTAGSTPAQPSKIMHRRESSMFSTPGMPRPPSALSDTSAKEGSKDRKAETPSTVATRALGKSVRANGSAPTSKPLGSMGPPPTKPRMSVGTPTPTLSRAPSALSRSMSSAPSTNATPGPHRRASSTTLAKARAAASPVPSEGGEKENLSTPATVKTARRASIPVPA